MVHFVTHSPLWVYLMSPYDWIQVMHFCQGCYRSDGAFNPSRWHTVYICPITDNAPSDYIWWCRPGLSTLVTLSPLELRGISWAVLWGCVYILFIIVCLYPCVDSWFPTLWGIIHYYQNLLRCSNCPQFDQREPHQLGFSFFVKHVCHSLACSYTKRGSRLL